MLAKDIKFSELLGQEPETGFPLFGSMRMMMSGQLSMGLMAKEMLQMIGLDTFSAMMSRFGYQTGMGAALEIASMYDFDSPEEWLKAAVVIGRLAGHADAEIEIHTFNRETRVLQFSVISRSSFEVASWQSTMGRKAEEPICYISTGMLSGFASVVFGSEVLVKETACGAQGHGHCQAEGRSASGWGMSRAKVRELWEKMALNPFENEMETLREKLQKTKKDLERQKEKFYKLKSRNFYQADQHGVIYRSTGMQQLIRLTDKVAPTKSTVLIQGESGTGKEVIARYIHEHSGRKKQPFRAVNCAALPPKLLESELFGHVKGAFTGADSNHKGLLLEAGDGSFFLDEIGELPLELQSKFLRILQEKEVRPVGGLKSIPVKARIIAATNRDLKAQVKEKTFREDLYYRLAVFPLTVQPLRERKEDILLLSRHFLEKLHKGHPGFSPAAIRVMERYSWPGNIRELENGIEYAVIMAGDEKILPEHFPASMTSEGTLSGILSDFPTLKELEKRYVQKVLQSTGGNKTKAAEILGTSTTTLWRRLSNQ